MCMRRNIFLEETQRFGSRESAVGHRERPRGNGFAADERLGFAWDRYQWRRGRPWAGSAAGRASARGGLAPMVIPLSSTKYIVAYMGRDVKGGEEAKSRVHLRRISERRRVKTARGGRLG